MSSRLGGVAVLPSRRTKEDIMRVAALVGSESLVEADTPTQQPQHSHGEGVGHPGRVSQETGICSD